MKNPPIISAPKRQIFMKLGRYAIMLKVTFTGLYQNLIKIGAHTIPLKWSIAKKKAYLNRQVGERFIEIIIIYIVRILTDHNVIAAMICESVNIFVIDWLSVINLIDHRVECCSMHFVGMQWIHKMWVQKHIACVM